jgi:hypothetical protein
MTGLVTTEKWKKSLLVQKVEKKKHRRRSVTREKMSRGSHDHDRSLDRRAEEVDDARLASATLD